MKTKLNIDAIEDHSIPIEKLQESIFDIANAMVYKGSVNANSDLPAVHKVGWTYRVNTAGEYVGVNCEVGDLIICIIEGTSQDDTHWSVGQTNIDGAVIGPASSTSGNVAIFDGETGKFIKDSGKQLTPESIGALSSSGGELTGDLTAPNFIGDLQGNANFATDLTGRNEATIEEFTFRPSAGNKSIRDDSATIKRIKGNSIVWNQMCDFTNGVFTFGGASGIKDTEGYTITINESSTTNAIFQFSSPIPFYSHKWLAIATIKSPIKVNIKGMPTQGFVPNTKCDIYSFYQSDNRNWYWGLSIESVGTISEIKVYNYLLFDLTQMFGAGNEPDTVEEFRALFPGNHYEYNPGQLVSMTADGLFTNGFNQWDEEWESGVYRYWSDGQKVDNSEYIRSVNFVRVIPAKTYCLNRAAGVDTPVCFYDENNNFLGQASYSYRDNWRIFQVPANCQKITFYTKATTYNNDICINLSHTGVENGKYEPYWDATKDLSIIQKYFPNGMRSAGSIYDEISFDETTQKWVAIQRVGNVDLGSLSWSQNPSYGFYVSIGELSGIQNVTDNNINANILCTKYTTGRAGDIFTQVKTNSIAVSTTHLVVGDLTYNTANDFKTAMSGVLLNYELAEPIITVIEEPINLSYKVGDFGIEQTLSDSFSAPFRADIIYQFNATDRIRENSSNIEKLSKTQNEYLLLAGGTMSGQINSQDIKPVEDSTYQLGDSTHKYKNVFSDFFTGNLEGNAKTATVATDLSGRVEATPEVFTYRPSAGEKSIKDDNAFIRRVKGNSVVFNQMLKNGNFATTTDWSPYQSANVSLNWDNGLTVTSNYAGTGGDPISVRQAIAQPFILGHKYFVHFEFSTSNTSLTPLVECFNALYSNEKKVDYVQSGNHYYSINNVKDTRTTDCYLKAIGTKAVGDTWTFKDVMIIDLTQMFGAGNEPTTVEEFRALYPNSYYPYNTGELRNLVCSGIKTVGFNQWDEVWNIGYISTNNGVDDASNTCIRSVNYIKSLSNTDYIGTHTGQYITIAFYDNSKQYIGCVSTQNLFTTPTNCAFIRFFVEYGTTVSTYNNDICINLHHTGWRDGEYEPYKEVTHSLPLSQITNGEPLRKAGSVYDEVNETEYIRRVGVVDLGSLNWKLWAHNIFGCEIQNFAFTTTDSARLNGLFCSKYTIDSVASVDATMSDKTMKRKQGVLHIRDTSFADAASFKAALSGIMLNYELAEPIVTPITTPIDFNYYVEDFGTEEALLAEDSAPFSADIVYQFNATDQIRNNSRNIDKLQKSAFTPRGTSAQYIRGDGSYGNVLEFTQAIPINDGEYEMPDAIHQFILTPNYYAKSPVELDNTTTVTVYVTPPEDSNYLAEYWFEFKTGEVLPDITFTSSTEDTKFRIAGDMLGDAVNILHLISSDGGMTFFGEMKHYIL